MFMLFPNITWQGIFLKMKERRKTERTMWYCSWTENNEAVAGVHVSDNQAALKTAVPTSHHPTYEPLGIVRSSCQAVTCKAFLTVFYFWLCVLLKLWLWAEGMMGAQLCATSSMSDHWLTENYTRSWMNACQMEEARGRLCQSGSLEALALRWGLGDFTECHSILVYRATMWPVQLFQALGGGKVQCPPVYWNSLKGKLQERHQSHSRGCNEPPAKPWMRDRALRIANLICLAAHGTFQSLHGSSCITKQGLKQTEIERVPLFSFFFFLSE